jgi:hypothetical protein
MLSTVSIDIGDTLEPDQWLMICAGALASVKYNVYSMERTGYLRPIPYSCNRLLKLY